MHSRAPGAFVCANIVQLQAIEDAERDYISTLDVYATFTRDQLDQFVTHRGKPVAPSPELYGCVLVKAGDPIHVLRPLPMFIAAQVEARDGEYVVKGVTSTEMLSR